MLISKIVYIKLSDIYLQTINQLKDMTTPTRNQVQLNKQASQMLMRVYEDIAGQNLYGHCPMPSKSIYYRKAYQKCLTICDRYNDSELRQEYERNFRP